MLLLLIFFLFVNKIMIIFWKIEFYDINFDINYDKIYNITLKNRFIPIIQGLFYFINP